MTCERKKLVLAVDEELGFLGAKFERRAVNVLLVFQVNCPGCFIYALPMMNALADSFGDRVGLLAVSTAFEDFELNTVENTRALVNSGTIVGETRRAQGRDTLSVDERPRFPVAFDQRRQPPDGMQMLPFVSTTFFANQLRGTPSFIVFDAEDRVLDSWFGHGRTRHRLLEQLRALLPEDRNVNTTTTATTTTAATSGGGSA
eukprot:TRINITY_DN2968_c0_g1_i1.p1 TRINITY_DN2968_c0_g1~~TRINITY_DN2968_c0_g1_i1.p1  ORF type:complete len:202 (-),score=38.24 TRINITY_DN2968_c0_g1_i1:48-653(-)